MPTSSARPPQPQLRHAQDDEITYFFSSLLEHHALFLDKIHLHALVVYRSLGKLAEKDDPKKLHNKFRHEGIPGKYKMLRERLGLIRRTAPPLTSYTRRGTR